MGLFSTVATATYRKGGNYPPCIDANYLLELNLIEVGKQRAPKNTDFVSLNFKVIESSTPQRPPGSAVDVFCDFGNDSGPGNYKAALVALFGTQLKKFVGDEEVGESEAEFAAGHPVGEDGKPLPNSLKGTAMRGVRVRLQTTAATTKAGKPFTRMAWQPIFE